MHPDGAKEVQLVDLPVEGLIERLQLGKVYSEGRAKQALRRTAAGVDDSLERYMREHEIEEVWSVADRVAENPALVLLRHVPQGRWWRFFRSSLVDQLLGKLVHVDIHLEEEDAG